MWTLSCSHSDIDASLNCILVAELLPAFRIPSQHSPVSAVLPAPFVYSVSDKVMLEAWLWDSTENTTAAQQAALMLLEGFLSVTPNPPRPMEQLVLTRSFEHYMLSQPVTDCYGVPESAWGWANISTNEATHAAEHAWRAGGSTNTPWVSGGGGLRGCRPSTVRWFG